MSNWRRAIWLFAMFSLLVMTGACSRQVVRPVSEELARDGTRIRTDEGQEISGYQLVDRDVTKLDGAVRLVEPDSLAFTRYVKYGGTGMIEKPGPTYNLDAVRALVFTEAKSGATIALVAGMFVVGILVYALATLDLGEFSN